MQIVRFARWELECDPEATRAAYAKRPIGAPEECGCQGCRNFAAARHKVYPPEIIILFERLGVTPAREAEICHYGPGPSELHTYGGWFHMIGRIIGGSKPGQGSPGSGLTFDFEQVNEHFSLGFSEELALVPEAFNGRALTQIEFMAQVPWVLDEPMAC